MKKRACIGTLSLSSSFPFVRGEVLLATFSPPHLIIFYTLLCLLSSSSSLPPLLPSSHLSYHSPPISVLASLVLSCPAHVTLPLSSVMRHPFYVSSQLQSAPHQSLCQAPLHSRLFHYLHYSSHVSALITLAILRTQLISHTCSLFCCSSVSANVAYVSKTVNCSMI